MELLQYAMHFRRVLEAVQANGDSNHFRMGPIVVLGKPLDQVGVIQDLFGMATLVGHAKIVLTRDQNVGFPDVRLQEVSEDVAVTSRVDLCVDDGHLTMMVEFSPHQKNISNSHACISSSPGAGFGQPIRDRRPIRRIR